MSGAAAATQKRAKPVNRLIDLDARERPLFRLGELFAGPGGLGLAAKWSGIKHVWATDIDKDSCATYAHNVLDKRNVVCSDIRKLEFSRLAEIGEVNALSFGFPCNDFSAVGERAGLNGSYGELYEYCVAAVKFFKPIWFLGENVSGLKNANSGSAFKRILNEFSQCGYKLYPHLYKFEEYGVPQRRHRIIVIGIRNDFDIPFKIPKPPKIDPKEISVRFALKNPPISAGAFNHEFTNQSPIVERRLSYIKPGENAFNANLPEDLKLNVKGATISQIYRRLHPDLPAYTITGSGGGGTHVYHWKENRALTNRERARLQTFPDNFIFLGGKESVRKQIGMAVPPKGAKFILSAILDSFQGVSYCEVEQNIDDGYLNKIAV